MGVIHKSAIQIGRRIPGGIAKDILFWLYHQALFQKEVLFNDSVTIVRRNGAYQYTFNDGYPKGVSFLLPKTHPANLYDAPHSIPGFFFDGIERVQHVFNIGAFPGDYAAVVSQILPHAKLTLLEPNPENRKILLESLRLNGMHTQVEEYGLSDRKGNAEIELYGERSRIVSATIKARKPTAPIKTITLDDLMSVHGWPEQALVQMDVEGAEVDIVRAAQRTLLHGVTFVIAAYHNLNGKISYDYLCDIFADANYSTRVICHEHLTLLAQPKNN